mmetsp:Transcript_56397/g.132260  ORF Transcript_56397/g.132260 Transcript_56397/m.132260 type:complete len:1231 (+) Transcript_56397:37-3729(+)
MASNAADRAPWQLCGPPELQGRLQRHRNSVIKECSEAAGFELEKSEEVAGSWGSKQMKFQQCLLPELHIAAVLLHQRGLGRNAIRTVFTFLHCTRPRTACESSWSPIAELVLQPFAQSTQTRNVHLCYVLGAAWQEDAESCVRAILRLGEWRRRADRHVFFDAILWLWNNYPVVLLANLHSVPKLGCWKHLCELLARACEGEEVARKKDRAWRYKLIRKDARLTADDGVHMLRSPGRLASAEKAVRRFDEDPLYRALYIRCSQLFAEQLAVDLRDKASNPLAARSLCARWCPGLDTSFDRRTLLCEGIARAYYPQSQQSEWSGLSDREYAFRARDRLRREVLVPLKLPWVQPSVRASASAMRPPPGLPSPDMQMPQPAKDGEAMPKHGWGSHDGQIMKRCLRHVQANRKQGKYWADAQVDSTDPRYLQYIRVVGTDHARNARQRLPGGVQAALALACWVRKASYRPASAMRGLDAGLTAAVLDTSCGMNRDACTGVSCRVVAVAIALILAEARGVLEHTVLLGGNEVMELKEEKLRARAALLLRHGSLLKLDLQSTLQTLLTRTQAALDDNPTLPTVRRLLFLTPTSANVMTAELETSIANTLGRYEGIYAEAGVPFPDIIFWDLSSGSAAPCLEHYPGYTQVRGFSLALLSLVLAPNGNGGMHQLDPSEVVARALASRQEVHLPQGMGGVRHIIDPILREADMIFPSATCLPRQLRLADNTRNIHPREPLGLDICLVIEDKVLSSWRLFNLYKERLDSVAGFALQEAQRLEGNGKRLPLRISSVNYTRQIFDVCVTSSRPRVTEFREAILSADGHLAPWGQPDYYSSRSDRELFTQLLPGMSPSRYAVDAVTTAGWDNSLVDGVHTALDLEWKSSWRFLILVSDRVPKVKTWGACAAGIMSRADTLGIQVMVMGIGQEMEALRLLLERQCRRLDGRVPRLYVPDARRSHSHAGHHFQETIGCAMAQRLEVMKVCAAMGMEGRCPPGVKDERRTSLVTCSLLQRQYGWRAASRLLIAPLSGLNQLQQMLRNKIRQECLGAEGVASKHSWYHRLRIWVDVLPAACEPAHAFTKRLYGEHAYLRVNLRGKMTGGEAEVLRKLVRVIAKEWASQVVDPEEKSCPKGEKRRKEREAEEEARFLDGVANSCDFKDDAQRRMDERGRNQRIENKQRASTLEAKATRPEPVPKARGGRRKPGENLLGLARALAAGAEDVADSGDEDQYLADSGDEEG